MSNVEIRGTSAEVFVHRILEVRQLHCNAKWRSIRSESLEPSSVTDFDDVDIDEGRRNWLGYKNEEEEEKGRMKFRNQSTTSTSKEESGMKYEGFHKEGKLSPDDRDHNIADEVSYEEEDESRSESSNEDDDAEKWKEYWAEANDDDENEVKES